MKLMWMIWAENEAHMGRLEMRTKYWLQSLKEREQSEGVGVDLKKKASKRGWILLAENRVPWRPFVNTVMNLRVIKKGGKYLD
jgi:hypothetical protein